MSFPAAMGSLILEGLIECPTFRPLAVLAKDTFESQGRLNRVAALVAGSQTAGP